MKKLVLVIFGLVLVAGCKSFTPVTSATSIDTNLRPKIVQQQVSDNALAFQTLQWRGHAQVNQNGSRQRISLTARIKKGEAIWMNASVVIPVGRLKITPKSLQFYEKIGRGYINLNYAELEKLVGVGITYSMLENILTAKAIDKRLLKKAKLSHTKKSYVWTTKRRGVTAEFIYDASSRLMRQTLEDGKAKLVTRYDNYVKNGSQWIPKHIHIAYSDGTKSTSVELRAKQTRLNGSISIPFSIPNDYAPILAK